jgi:hypothetical protein
MFSFITSQTITLHLTEQEQSSLCKCAKKHSAELPSFMTLCDQFKIIHGYKSGLWNTALHEICILVIHFNLRKMPFLKLYITRLFIFITIIIVPITRWSIWKLKKIVWTHLISKSQLSCSFNISLTYFLNFISRLLYLFQFF